MRLATMMRCWTGRNAPPSNSSDRRSGAWIFRGTRVPVKALFENLESGARLEDFLEWFPGVAREQAEAVLEHAARSLLVA